ncbi:hypothetical protein, partial [Synechococcus lacustris]|uniref:hypothetical protein n=1 Tax=Synechococcus lacustris TaxID=2116544 RepID=UPI0020CCB2CD
MPAQNKVRVSFEPKALVTAKLYREFDDESTKLAVTSLPARNNFIAAKPTDVGSKPIDVVSKLPDCITKLAVSVIPKERAEAFSPPALGSLSSLRIRLRSLLSPK